LYIQSPNLFQWGAKLRLAPGFPIFAWARVVFAVNNNCAAYHTLSHAAILPVSISILSTGRALTTSKFFSVFSELHRRTEFGKQM